MTDAKDCRALAQPVLALSHHGTNDERSPDIDAPVPTVAGHGGLGLADPIIAQLYGGNIETGAADSIDDPLATVTASNHHALVEPIVASIHGLKGGDGRTRTIDEPLGTTGASGNQHALAETAIAPHGASAPGDIDSPAAGPYFLLDGMPIAINILYRMLHSSELARAHSLGHVRFAGNESDAIKQIGNSIPAQTASKMIAGVLLPTLAEFEDFARAIDSRVNPLSALSARCA